MHTIREMLILGVFFSWIKCLSLLADYVERATLKCEMSRFSSLELCTTIYLTMSQSVRILQISFSGGNVRGLYLEECSRVCKVIPGGQYFVVDIAITILFVFRTVFRLPSAILLGLDSPPPPPSCKHSFLPKSCYLNTCFGILNSSILWTSVPFRTTITASF